MLRAILVDDEVLALNSLEKELAEYCGEEVTVVDTCQSPVKALISIRAHKPDLVFLDIRMDAYELDGFGMLEILGEIDFSIIFVTGHPEHAAQAFKVNAVDFLVKPFSADELQAAVQKVAQKKTTLDSDTLKHLLAQLQNPTSDQARQVHFPVIDGFIFKQPDDIMYCMAEGAYTRVYLRDEKPFLTSKLIRVIEEMLPSSHFFRIHHSHLMNRMYLKKYQRGNGGVVYMADGRELNVAKSKKQAFLKWMNLAHQERSS